MPDIALESDHSAQRRALRDVLVDIAERIVPAPLSHPDRLSGESDFPTRSFHEALLDAEYWGGVKPYADPRELRRAYGRGLIRPDCLRWAIGRSVIAAIGLDRPLLGRFATVGHVLELATVEGIGLLWGTEAGADGAAEDATELVTACRDRVLRLGAPSTKTARPIALHEDEGFVRGAARSAARSAHDVLVAYLRDFLAQRRATARSLSFYAAVRDGSLAGPKRAPAWLASFEAAIGSERTPGGAEAAVGAALELLSTPPTRYEAHLDWLARVERRAIGRLAHRRRTGEQGDGRLAALTEVLAVQPAARRGARRARRTAARPARSRLVDDRDRRAPGIRARRPAVRRSRGLPAGRERADAMRRCLFACVCSLAVASPLAASFVEEYAASDARARASSVLRGSPAAGADGRADSSHLGRVTHLRLLFLFRGKSS